MTVRATPAILVGLVCLMSANGKAQDADKLLKADFARVVADPENDASFRQLLDKLPKITAGESPGRVYYVLEGDLLLTERQVRDTFRRYSTDPRPASPTGELKVMTANGKMVFWPGQNRHLTYTIDAVGFTPAERQVVAKNLKAATRSWVDACPTCGLSFNEVSGAPNQATFHVVKVGDEGGFLASSFFPSDPADMRMLRVAAGYFRLGPGGFDQVGVLRHELGHVLGYRHEHIADVPGCAHEDNNWRPLTKYDNKSVMHYFCGGGGTMTLDLTAADRAGHKALYGRHP